MTRPSAPVVDHRVRVGAKRRENTRLRLLQSALQVFTNNGPDSITIDDVIVVAGVSRGTFYNHFRTTNELSLALATSMSDEVLAVVDPAVQTFADPVHRFSVGTRLYMHTSLRYLQWGHFIATVGTRIAARGQLIDLVLMRDLKSALAARRVTVTDLLVARDIVLGSIFYGVETMLTEPTHEHHAEQLVATFLRGMGVAAGEADAIAYMPLPDLPPLQGPIFSSLSVQRKTTRAGPSATSGRRIAKRRTTAA